MTRGRLTQRLECHLHTVEVTGSNPVSPTGQTITLGLSRVRSSRRFVRCFQATPIRRAPGILRSVPSVGSNGDCATSAATGPSRLAVSVLIFRPGSRFRGLELFSTSFRGGQSIVTRSADVFRCGSCQQPRSRFTVGIGKAVDGVQDSFGQRDVDGSPFPRLANVGYSSGRVAKRS